MGFRGALFNTLGAAVVALGVRQTVTGGPRATAADPEQPPPRAAAPTPAPVPPPVAAPRNPAANDPLYVRRGASLMTSHLGAPFDAAHPHPAVRVCTFIALVPDPIDSRLDWQFDAGVESIRRAFEVSGFVLERFWLPWSLDADSALRKRDRTNPPLDLRRRNPGVLLFRRATDDRQARFPVPPPDTTLAVAYLIGESPASGIHQRAFDAALADRAEMARLAGPCPEPSVAAYDDLRIIGPTFSGSIESLRRRLTAWRTGTPAGGAGSPAPTDARTRRATVVSGGANSPTIGVDMTRGDSLIRFTTTMNPLDVMLDKLCDDVLSDALALRPGDVAVLKESSTTFGAAAQEGIDNARLDRSRAHATHAGEATPRFACQQMLTVPFPMSISRLRREYARRPATSDAPAPMAFGTAAPRVALDLQDPASSFENPPSFSDLTPAAIERVMDDIAQTLLAHRVRAVVVIATDVRDRIFVASEVKRRLRDVRLVFIGGHALYTRPEFNEELRGALVVSTYPLFLENQYWTRFAFHQTERLVFSNELAEGAYNATVFQLAALSGRLALRDSVLAAQLATRGADPPLGTDAALAAWRAADAAAMATSDSGATCVALAGGRLADYRPPHSHADTARDVADTVPAPETRPPVWVTIVGRMTIAPVRAYVVDAASWSPLTRGLVATGCPVDAPDSLAREARPTGFGLWEPAALYGIALMLAAVLWFALTTRAYVGAALPIAPARWSVARSLRAELAYRRTHELPLESPAVTALERSGELHAHAAGVLRPLIAFCMLAPFLLMPLRALTHWWKIDWPILVPLLAVALLAALLTALFAFTELIRLWEVAPRAPLGARVHSAVLVVGGLAYTVAMLRFVASYMVLEPPMSAEVFTRAVQLGSGVTPLLPLAIGGAFLLVWAEQHARRARALRLRYAAEAWRPDNGDGIRRGLLRIVDGWQSVVVGFVLLGVSAWMLLDLQRSPEAIVSSGMDSFDVVHRSMLVALLVLTTWTVLRFARTWRALRDELRALQGSPYVEAFTRLPAALGTLVRLTPLQAPTTVEAGQMVQSEIATRSNQLRTASARTWQRIFGPSETRVAPTTCAIDSDIRSRVLARRGARRLAVALRSTTILPAGNKPARAAAEEIAALMATDYLGWIVRHLRHLAIGVVASTALGTLLLSCYPFEPHTFVRICFFLVAGIGIAILVAVLVQMNRDPVLSRITRTNLGEVTWDVPFLANLAAIVGIPLVTILGSQFPEVRDFLFGWLAPLLKTVGRG